MTITEIARKFQEAAQRVERLGLKPDKKAYHDALAMNEVAVRNLGDEIPKDHR
jgi:type I restriction enzyme R subunit